MASAPNRPYDEDAKLLSIEICNLIATNPIPLVKILQSDARFPSSATFFRWKMDSEFLREMYLAAKKSQIDVMMDNVNARVLDDSQDIIVQPDGKLTPNSVRVARDQLIYRATAWQAARLSPKVYGERIMTENKTENIISADQATKDLLKRIHQAYKEGAEKEF